MTIEQAVDLAIQNIAKKGLTDIFHEPFELEFLKNDSYRLKIKNHITKCLKQRHFSQFDIKPISHILMPKSGKPYDFRRTALISPACTIKFLALAILAAPVIEQKRIPISEKVVFSYRFEPKDGLLFSEEGGYNKWRDEITKIRATGNFSIVVKCDLANFYDHINLHRLESTLQDIGIEGWVVSAINDTLTFWSQKDSYGLPVGSNASRILAEAALIDVDNYLVSEKIKFVRFVDDYRIFAEDPITAQKYLALLTSRLFREGLYLNASKTVIYPAELKEQSDEPEKTEKNPDAEIILQEFFDHVGRYRTIPRRFMLPREEKFNAFRQVDIKKELDDIRSNLIVEFKSIQKILIAILAQKKFSFLVNIDELILRCIYGVDYIIDMLDKNGTYIPPDIRQKLVAKFEQLLTSGFFGNLEWYEYKILTLLGSDNFFSNEVLVKYFRNVNIEKTELVTFTSLEMLFHRTTRTEVKTIRDSYSRADEWSKRRIMKLVTDTLPDQEAKAWFRMIRTSRWSDIFTEIAYKEYRPK